MMATTAPPLAGVRVLVTRPRNQAQPLAALIRAAGGEALIFPVLEIQEPPDPEPARRLLARLPEFDIAIFISPNAVNRALALAALGRPLADGPLTLPPGLLLAAVGPGTATALQQHFSRPVIVPRERFDSEGLLTLPEFENVTGKRIALLRGNGGRDWLEKTLLRRGAVVEAAECYRRARPATGGQELFALWESGMHCAITITSSEGLRNLWELAGAAARLRLVATPLLAPHPRIAETARSLGFQDVTVTRGADQGLLEGLLSRFRGKSDHA